MKFEMVMPKMGESITEGTILKWLKAPGDTVEKDEIILEISTDKVDSEIPTPVPGKIVEFLAAENDTVAVGAAIAVIETEASGIAAEAAAEATTSEATPEQEVAAAPSPSKPPKPAKDVNRFYSPLVLSIAAREGVSMDELATISGSGQRGRVTKKDILTYLDKRIAVPAPGVAAHPAAATVQNIPTAAGPAEVVPMDNMRKSIAAHMIQSKQTSAHVSLYTEVDMYNVTRLRDKHKASFKQREGFSLTYTAFIVQAVVQALQEYPELNASIENDAIVYKKYYNIGVAVAVDRGLIVPNIFNADEKNLTGLARAVNDIATRARNKKLQPDELKNGTFSISNFGVYGVSVGFPIINQPQSAILGVGAIKKRPVVINDAIAIRPIMYLALTIDHRLIDGAAGSMFLERIRFLLEAYDPEGNL